MKNIENKFEKKLNSTKNFSNTKEENITGSDYLGKLVNILIE